MGRAFRSYSRFPLLGGHELDCCTVCVGGLRGLSRPRKGKNARALGASATRVHVEAGGLVWAERALVPLQVPEARKDTYRKLLTRWCPTQAP